MSGHSKWNSIKHKKAVADAKRGKVFTKFGRNITIAAKEMGSDLDTNFKLRIAVDKAKAANMPKDNIERAIKRGTGELDGSLIEEIVYESFATGGVAIIIEVLTGNKNRTVSSIKTILSKRGGALAGANSVLWMFDRKGVFLIKEESFSNISIDEIELFLIDLGAEDIKVFKDDGFNFYRIITSLEDFNDFQKKLHKNGIEAEEAELEYIPKEEVNISEDKKESICRLLEALDEDDDVCNLYCNVDL